MKNNRKAIIAVWHSAAKGKTQTLRALSEQLVSEHQSRYREADTPSPTEYGDGDINLTIDFEGVRVCVESRGDPGTGLEDRLRNLVNDSKADLIFCATRSRGETPGAVDRVAKIEGHDVIWTSTYQTDKSHSKLNWMKAQHLLNMVKELHLLP